VVTEGAAPGIYPLTMECAGHILRLTLTVADEDGRPPPSPPDIVLHINPTAARPGEQVFVQVACDADGAAVTSPVLGPISLQSDPEGHQPWAVHGTTTVNQDAEPGDYPVSLQCGEVSVDMLFTVLQRQPDNHAKKCGNREEQVFQVPRSIPETEDGIQDTSIQDTRTQDTSTQQDVPGPGPLLAVGLGVCAAAGAAAIVWRRVRSRSV
jgi:hypothetical protein